jgi:hypothetical protein
LYNFHKKLKIKKTKKNIFTGFLGGFLGFFWVGFLLPTLEQGGHVEAAGEGRPRDVRRVQDDAVQPPLDLRDVRDVRLPGLLSVSSRRPGEG